MMCSDTHFEILYPLVLKTSESVKRDPSCLLPVLDCYLVNIVNKPAGRNITKAL
jgi:hypothetical protein